MQFHIVTLFPQIFDSFLTTSLVGKAAEAGRIRFNLVDPRDFTQDRHHTTDDVPFGGGEGMVMKPEPVIQALESIPYSPDGSRPYRVMLTPQGELLQQKHLNILSQQENVVLVCGRYEGFDERVREYVDQEISLGDFVLGGGEVAAMVVIEGIARLIPGVIGNAQSLIFESHTSGLLEYPQYTRPRSFRGRDVPEVLLSGDHERIRRWRRQQMLLRTRKRRPDLWQRYCCSEEDLELLNEQPRSPNSVEELASRTYIALLHYPVYDRNKQVVTSAITNLDLHDIARSCRTYGLAGYFVVTPLTSQQELARRIVSHWKTGHGALYNSRRRDALLLLEVASNLEEVKAQVQAREGRQGKYVVTSAVARPGQLTWSELMPRLPDGEPLIFLLGTGWGLTEEMVQSADWMLAPFRGRTAYNHLSVRSAAAILLDRIFGLRE